MHPVNTLIDKTYVLTIERNKNRHPQIKSVLKNIDFEFWYGIDAPVRFGDKKYVHEIEDEFLIEHGLGKNFVHWYNMAQFGAYLSIKKMIDNIAVNGYERSIIFEDDAIPMVKNWEDIFQKALQELPEDWDILLLGYMYGGKLYELSLKRYLRPLVRLAYFFRNKRALKVPVKYSKHVDYSEKFVGGHAMCLSKKGAMILSDYLNPMVLSGDLLINDLLSMKKIKCFSIVPVLFDQDRITFKSMTDWGVFESGKGLVKYKKR